MIVSIMFEGNIMKRLLSFDSIMFEGNIMKRLLSFDSIMIEGSIMKRLLSLWLDYDRVKETVITVMSNYS